MYTLLIEVRLRTTISRMHPYVLLMISRMHPYVLLMISRRMQPSRYASNGPISQWLIRSPLDASTHTVPSPHSVP